MSGRNDVDVSVIVVNWNAGDRLGACARSLAAAAASVAAELVVVDNGSHDGSLRGVEAAAAPLRTHVLPLGRNVGFAAGTNAGLALARGRHALLLNPDAELVPRALDVLAGWLDRRPDLGALGCRVVDTTGRPEATVGTFPTVGEKVRRLFGGGTGAAVPSGEGTPVDVDWVSGACLALGRPALAAGVRLDPGYPLYFEDVDLCRRIWAAGLRVAVLPETLAVHARGGTATGAPTRRRLRRYGEARYHRKWGGAGGRVMALAYTLLARAWRPEASRLPDAPEHAERP